MIYILVAESLLLLLGVLLSPSLYGVILIWIAIILSIVFTSLCLKNLVSKSPLNPLPWYIFSTILYLITPYLFFVFFQYEQYLDIQPGTMLESCAYVLLAINIYMTTVEIFREPITRTSELAFKKLKCMRFSSLENSKYKYRSICVYPLSSLVFIVLVIQLARSDCLTLLANGFAFTDIVRKSFVEVESKNWFLVYLLMGSMYRVFSDLFSTYSRFKLKAFLKSFTFLLSLLPTSYFLIALLSGNRRQLIGIIIYLLAVYLTLSQQKGRKLVYVLLVPAGIALLSISMLRVMLNTNLTEGQLSIDATNIFANFFGEFIYPWYTFQYQFQNSTQYTGELYWITDFVDYTIGKLGGPELISKANAFSSSLWGADNMMGFAYTQVSEAYLSLGLIGIILYSPMLIILLQFIFSILLSLTPFAAPLMISLALDFGRSDLFSYLIQFSLILTGFFLNKNFKPLFI
jgi:hypothetical protein